MVLTRKQKRSGLILGGLGLLGLAVGLVLYALTLSGSIVFFVTPSEIAEKGIEPGQRIRLGGLVETGSVVKGASVSFVVTDRIKSLPVRFSGQLPDLFREGQGVVAEGALDASHTFIADTVLAKHDETYMPKDVADKLKEKGVWREGGQP